jgi:hypothetical protein
VAKAIERETHNAHAGGGRPAALAYNSFMIFKTEEKYSTRAQLERDYKIKGVRNLMSFSDQVGPYIKELWAYRKETPLAYDFIFLMPAKIIVVNQREEQRARRRRGVAR